MYTPNSLVHYNYYYYTTLLLLKYNIIIVSGETESRYNTARTSTLKRLSVKGMHAYIHHLVQYRGGIISYYF